MTFYQPLDLQSWLVNTLSGGWTIFIFLSFIVIAYMAARFRMPNMVVMIMFAVFTILLANYMGGIYIMVIIISAMIIYYSVAKPYQ